MIITGYEDVVSNLGFDAQQAIKEITRLSQAMERLEAVMRSTAGSIGVFNTAGAKFQGVSTNIKTLSNSQRELINVSGQVPKIMKSNFVSMESLENQAKRLSSQVQRSSKQMILSWQSVLRIFTIQIAHQAIARLTGLLRDSLSSAIDYEIQLAAIQTINENFAGGLDATSAAISNLATEFARPVEDIAAGFYNILSDQIENTSDALLILNESLKLSRATLATTEEAASTLTGVINAFGLQTFETSKISDILFRTVDLGRVTLSELANALGRVNVLSARLGVTFEEQQAALATITIQGIDASEGMTFLRNAFLKLLSPTESMKKAFDEIGVSSAEAGIAAFGLQGFLEKLVSVSGDTATELGEIFGRLRATQGALALTGENAERFREALKRIQDAAGAATKASEEIAGTSAEQLRAAAQQIRTDFIGVGRDINASFLSVIKSIGGTRGALTALLPSVSALGFAFGALALSALIEQFRKFTDITKVATARMTAATIAATAAIVVINQFGESLSAAQSRIEREAQAALDIRLKQIQAEVDARRNSIRQQSQQDLQLIAERTRLRNQDANNAARFAQQTLAIQKFNLDQQVQIARDRVGKIEKILTDSQKRIAASQERILDQQFNREEFVFERRIRGLSQQQQIQEQLNRARKIELQAQDTLRKGDEQRAEALFDAAQQQRETALSSADQLGNQDLIRRSENAVKRGFDIRIKSQKDFIKDQETEAERARAILPILQQRRIELESQTKELKTQLELVKDGKFVFEDQAKAISASRDLLIDVNKRLAELGVAPAFTEEQIASAISNVFGRFEAEQARFGTQAGQEAAKRLGVVVRTGEEEAEITRQLRDQELKRQALIGQINASEASIARNLQVSKELNQNVDVLGGLFAALKDPTGKALKEFAQQGNKAVNIVAQQIQTGLVDGIDAINIEKTQQAFKDLGLDSGAAANSVQRIVSDLQKKQTAQIELEAINLSQFRKEVAKPIDVPVNLIQQNNGVVQNQARGGLIQHFATGGMAKGTDTVPAMLSPGEFVVNADSTRKFFSQLVAINRGIQPKYMAEGGPVTNVGDINITVKGGTTSGSTLRNIAEGLRREFRRGSIRSF